MNLPQSADAMQVPPFHASLVWPLQLQPRECHPLPLTRVAVDITLDEALARYGLTLEEFASWQRAVDRSGMHGLRVTKIQHYRDLYQRQLKY